MEKKLNKSLYVFSKNFSHSLMEIKNKTFGLFLILLTIIIFLSFSLFKFVRANVLLTNALPYLLSGEKIDSIDLIDIYQPSINKKDLTTSGLSLIFIIPKSSCITCNKNMIYWKKYADLFADSISIYGIILSDLSDANNFSQEAKLNFPLFVPGNLTVFTKQFRIRFNYPQTIVCIGNEIKDIQFGDLDGEKAVKVLKLIKELK